MIIGIMKKTDESTKQAQKESILDKIEADLYTEKIKNGKTPNKEDLINLINNKQYGTVEVKNEENILITKDGGYEIKFSEILGWEEQK